MGKDEVSIELMCYARNVAELSKVEKITVSVGLLTLILALLGTIAAWFVVPEFRRWTGLEKESQSDAPSTSSTTSKPDSPDQSPKKPAGAMGNSGWVDINDNEFYEFLDGGKIAFRRHRFDQPSLQSKDMTWYEIGSSVHFKDTSPYGKSCEGVHEGTSVKGTCRDNYSSSLPAKPWELRLLETKMPSKTRIAQSRKPEPTDGIWVANGLRANGDPVFYEFLASGEMRERHALHGPTFISSDNWYRVGETLRITLHLASGVIDCEGKVDGENIEISGKDLTGQPFIWKWERIEKRSK